MGSDVEITAADREKAAVLVANWSLHFGPDDLDPLRAMVETYLADERAKARAPFLALAEDLARHTVKPETDRDRGFITGLDMGARYIRRVAEDSPEVRET